MPNLRKLLFSIVMICVVATPALSGCQTLPAGFITTPATPAPMESLLSITEIPLKDGMHFYQDPISLEKLRGVESVTQSGLESLYNFTRFGPTDSELTSGVNAILEPGQSLSGFLMVIDSMDLPHDFGLLATLDYEPVQVLFNGTPQSMPMLSLKPGERRMFRFSLPPLAEGLHTFVVTYIAEPKLNFLDFDKPAGPDEFKMDAFRWRDAPIGFGILIWVTPNKPENPSDWPYAARAFAPEETTYLTSITLLKEKPLPGKSARIFYKDTVTPGESVTYYMKLSTFVVGSKDIPMKVLIFWDDQLTNSQDVILPADAVLNEEYIPYTVQIPAHLEKGTHEITLVSYPFPYHLRAWKDGSSWRSNVRMFSHLIARVPMIVE